MYVNILEQFIKLAREKVHLVLNVVVAFSLTYSCFSITRFYINTGPERKDIKERLLLTA